MRNKYCRLLFHTRHKTLSIPTKRMKSRKTLKQGSNGQKVFELAAALGGTSNLSHVPLITFVVGQVPCYPVCRLVPTMVVCRLFPTMVICRLFPHVAPQCPHPLSLVSFHSLNYFPSPNSLVHLRRPMRGAGYLAVPRPRDSLSRSVRLHQRHPGSPSPPFCCSGPRRRLNTEHQGGVLR